MPSFSIRLRRVFGWSLRIRAAPLGPWMTPAVDSSTATMCRRSISSRGAMSSGTAARTPARPYRFVEIAIRRRDHPHVHPDGPARPHGLELLLLEDAKKLHLRLEGQLADLVEEDRAAIGELEAADAALQRTGEGTLHMPE